MIKLVKFRPLLTCRDYKRAVDILQTKRFWCSKFSDLNDPMEGVFSYTKASFDFENMYNEKCKYQICSFSEKQALFNPLMWGYYANGFKGVAVEICADEESIKKVNYTSNILDFSNGHIDDVKTLLTTKLKCWEHEAEYRFLYEYTDNDCNNYYEIGKITALYFGDPYGNVRNKTEVYNGSKILQKYSSFKGELIKEAQSKNIKCYDIRLGGRMQITTNEIKRRGGNGNNEGDGPPKIIFNK